MSEESIRRAMPRITRILAREPGGYSPSVRYAYSGSEILDQRMLRRIDEDIEAAITGERRRTLPPLPEGYKWLEYESVGATGKPIVQSAPRVLTPEGKVIAPEKVDEHAFATDRSLAGRVARVWERGLEGVRDATLRHQWGLGPEKQDWLNKVSDIGPVTRLAGDLVAGVGHIGAFAADVVNVPTQTLLGAGSQFVTEVQDGLHLPFWHYGTRPDDLWEAGGHANEEWTRKAPIAAAAFGASPVRLSTKAAMPKYHRDVQKALDAGYVVDDAEYLAQPYAGQWHHSPWATSADIRQAMKDGDYWLKKWGESKWIKKQPNGWSRLDAYIDHGLNDKYFYTANLKTGMQPFDKRRFGITHRGIIGREWHSVPTRMKLSIGSPFATVGGGLLMEEVLAEPKVPSDRD